MSHLHSTENLIFERLQQRQREQSQRLPVHPGTDHLSRLRQLIGHPGALFRVMGMKLQQIKQHAKSAI